ncbi:MAG: Ig-like domain-containing protein [Alteromonadaceae bacterium]|nr:Ig-like domain-containing protein [Alteromonadaceae bacterium]
MITEDPEALNTGGLFDYIADGLPDPGMTYAIVIPQRNPIPANAVYRQYRNVTGWGSFIINEKNSLWSTQGEQGYCPPPDTSENNTLWTSGLKVGHWCVQQIIDDGGVNDNDSTVNGTIVNLGGLSILNSLNHFPVAVDDFVDIYKNEATIEVLNNDTDQDGDTLFITSVFSNTGKVTIDNGSLRYVPRENYADNMTIDYWISDMKGGFDHAVVIIKIKLNVTPPISDGNSQINQNGDVNKAMTTVHKSGGVLYWVLLLMLTFVTYRRVWKSD